MCDSMNWSSNVFLGIMSTPYLIRSIFSIVAFYYAIYSPVKTLGMNCLLLCEAVSFLHDLIIVKFAELKLVKKATSEINMMTLTRELLKLRNSGVIGTFTVGWLLVNVGELFGIITWFD